MLFKRTYATMSKRIPLSVITLKVRMKNKAVQFALHLQKGFERLSHRKRWFSFISFWLLFSSVSTYQIFSGLIKTHSKNITVTSISSPSVIKNKSISKDTVRAVEKLYKQQKLNK
jgi:hypothetical protein